MAIVPGVTVNWDLSPRIITIPAPLDEITIEDLNDTLQDIEDSEEGITFKTLREISGKEQLASNVFVGLTCKLLNAKIEFEDRSGTNWIVCNVYGGNLVAVDANGVSMNPIEPSDYITVTKTSSTSASIIQVGSALTTEEHNQLANVENMTETIKQMFSGTWRMENNQFIMIKDDGVTELFRFNLTDDAGNPTMESPTRRIRV